MCDDVVSFVESFHSTLSTTTDVQFALAGGDPTAHPKWVEITRRLSTHSKVTVVTHGNSLTVEDFKALEGSHVEFQFSVPSLDDNTYRFLTGGSELESTLKNIARLTYFGFPLTLSSLICQKNIDEVAKLYWFAVENRCGYHDLNKFIPSGRGSLYETDFDISEEDFLHKVSKIDEQQSTKLLVSGEFRGARERKIDAPQYTVGIKGDVSLCSVAASNIGSLSADSHEIISQRYRDFWTSNQKMDGCVCSNVSLERAQAAS